MHYLLFNGLTGGVCQTDIHMKVLSAVCLAVLVPVLVIVTWVTHPRGSPLSCGQHGEKQAAVDRDSGSAGQDTAFFQPLFFLFYSRISQTALAFVMCVKEL